MCDLIRLRRVPDVLCLGMFGGMGGLAARGGWVGLARGRVMGGWDPPIVGRAVAYLKFRALPKRSGSKSVRQKRRAPSTAVHNS